MKRLKFRMVGLGLACFLIWLPNTALARTRCHISIGSRSHLNMRIRLIDSTEDHHRWMGRDQYRASYCYQPRYFRYPRHYRCGYLGTTIVPDSRDWYYPYEPGCYTIIDPSPLVIRTAPVVIGKKVVIVQPEKYDEETGKIFEQLRCEKAELLQNLKEENKEKRKEAINKLAGFSFDIQVRKALEDILLSDPDPELRKQVAGALANVKNKEVLPALEKARVEDPNEDVRKEADKAIRKIRE